MHRTTIVIPEDLLSQLRRMAAEQDRSMAAIIREALEDKAQQYRPRPGSLGIGASAFSDTARTSAEQRPMPRPWR